MCMCTCTYQATVPCVESPDHIKYSEDCADNIIIIMWKTSGKRKINSHLIISSRKSKSGLVTTRPARPVPLALNSHTTELCSYLQFVHRSNHVDTIVYNVGDGGVDLAVQSQETKVTQVNLSGGL